MDKKSKKALEIHSKIMTLTSKLSDLGYELVVNDCFGVFKSTTIRKKK